MAGMEDLQKPKPSLLSSALWAVAGGIVIFAENILLDRDMWHRPRFWIMSALGAVIVAFIFFVTQWLRWRK